MSSSADCFKQALQSLPHGDGFRFVDEVTALEPGISGAGNYVVRGTEDFLRGHFPGRPMLPAVIMVEALAQLGGVVAQTDPDIASMTDVRLTAMRSVKVLGTAVPGERLTLMVRVTGRLGNLIQLEGEIVCNERQIVRAQLTLSGQMSEDA